MRLAVAVVASALLFCACDKKEENEEVTQEQKETITNQHLVGFGEGAGAYYLNDRATDATGLTTEHRVYPPSPEWACTTGGWDEKPWSDLSYKPGKHFGEWCYRASSDRQRFAITVDGVLAGGGMLCMRFGVFGEGFDRRPSPNPPTVVSSKDDCF